MSTVNEVYIDGGLVGRGPIAVFRRGIDLAIENGSEIKIKPVRPAQHRVVERYVATVHLVLPGGNNSQAEAVDAVSAMLTDNLESHGVIDGWGYAKFGGHWLYPSMQHVRSPEQAEDSGDILDY